MLDLRCVSRASVIESGGPRNRMKLRITLLSLMVLTFQVTVRSAWAVGGESNFRAGAARTSITPEAGEIVGGFRPIPMQQVHDPLHARCLVFDDGRTQTAIVVCDLLGVHRSLADAARIAVQQATGIPASHVLISATHTHSAVSALGTDRFAHIQQLDDYQRYVVQKIAAGVGQAMNQLQPAQFASGAISVPEHVFNRRWFMREGTVPVNPFGETDLVKMNPPRGSDNLVRPAGPTDPQVTVFSVQTENGEQLAVWAVYSLHYVGGVRSGDVSADYFGVFCDRVEQRLADRSPAGGCLGLLSNGTSGNINNIDFRKRGPSREPYQQMRFVAEDVADRVVEFLPRLSHSKSMVLGAQFSELDLHWRIPNAEQLDWAVQTLASEPSAGGRVDLPAIYAERVRSLSRQPLVAPVPLQLLKLGPVTIGTMPCEVFCETGMAFREHFAGQPAVLLSLSQGYFGYLPTPEQHKLGGYETWLGTSRLETEASEKMLRQLYRMADSVTQAD